MKSNTKRVWLTHQELLETIAIVRAIKQAAVKQHNKAELRLMNEILNTLLDFDIDSKGTVVVLDSMTRYSLWNFVEQYATFCADNKMHIDYALAVTIATKLSG